MKLVVKSRDLKWAGSRLFRGSRFEVTSERERPLADLLLKLGKVELALDPKPLRRVASTVPQPAPEPQPEPAPDPDSQEEDHPDAPVLGRYRTRRLKSED